MSLRWSPYVAPKLPKWGLKTQNGSFRYKIALRLKKGCYKVCLCENRQWQSCKAFIGLSIRAKPIGGGRPLKRKFCIKWTFPWCVSHADQRFQEIRPPPRILYTHRNYYNGIWNYWQCSSTELTEVFGCITRLRINVDKKITSQEPTANCEVTIGLRFCQFCRLGRRIIALKIPYLYPNDDNFG